MHGVNTQRRVHGKCHTININVIHKIIMCSRWLGFCCAMSQSHAKHFQLVLTAIGVFFIFSLCILLVLVICVSHLLLFRLWMSIFGMARITRQILAHLPCTANLFDEMFVARFYHIVVNDSIPRKLKHSRDVVKKTFHIGDILLIIHKDSLSLNLFSILRLVGLLLNERTHFHFVASKDLFLMLLV